tara:strand:- start:12445 stop:18009 length:5565 start_codon:yes stop_codon:yes gene_type:complete
MNTDFSKNLSYQGKELTKPGTNLLGWITSAKSEGGGGYYQVRCPAIHGYCDIDENNCEEDVVAKAALPWIATIGTESANSAVRNNNVRQYGKGQFVVVRFDGPDYSSPVIISAHKAKHPVLGKKEDFDRTSPYVAAQLVEPLKDNKSGIQGDNGCFKVVTKASKIPENGESIKGADKCGDSGSLSSDIGAFIGDFLKIVQSTDGKIGSKFVNGLTGELFSMTGYIQKYLASISGVIRSGIGWVKAIITKYARKAIDQLVKLIMVPLKGVTSTINETIEKILNMVFCSFGNIEGLVSNMIEGLLNTLVDSAVNSVFGCLDTLVDGILNEIMGEVLGLVESIMGAIESIAGIIGGFGNLLGEAINAVLDFLGISCGGSGSCSTSASNALITAFNNPGEFGLTTGIKSSLEGGLQGINNLSNDINKSTAAANAEAAAFAKGVDLGTANVPGVSTDNQALRNAFTTATNIASSKVSDVFDFCNNLSKGKNGDGSDAPPSVPGDQAPYSPSSTYAVVIGKPDDRHDSEYMIFPKKETVKSGKTQRVQIRRNSTEHQGVIIFAAYLNPNDTARVVGITEGLASGGDIIKGSSLGDNKYGKAPRNKRKKIIQQFPKRKTVIFSEEVVFKKGQNQVTIDIPTVVAEPPKDEAGVQTTEEVTYTASIYRSSSDFNDKKFPYKNLPSTSEILNTTKLKIKFKPIEKKDEGVSDIYFPPEIITKNVNYVVGPVSVVAGQSAQFKVIRTPVVNFTTRVKCETIQDNTLTFPAIEGTHYTGGEGILSFAAGESMKIFSVPTFTDFSLNNATKTFKVKFTDELLPEKTGSNLGGLGQQGSTQVGEGVERTAVINYSTNFKPSPVCEPEIVLTSEPITCLVQEESIPLKIGFVAKASVPGYTLSYAWQRSYDPSGDTITAPNVIWTPVNDGVRTETINERVTTFGPSGVTIGGTTLDKWSTSTVAQSASITYSGAVTNRLKVAQPSYLIMDEEYYRCVITGTPSTPSEFTPVITFTTKPTYIGITKKGCYSSTVNCAPPGTLKDGDVISYTDVAATPAGFGESIELFENFKPRMTAESVLNELDAKFLNDGSGLKVTGDVGEGAVKLRFEWDDDPDKKGLAVGELFVAGKTFKQLKEKGSVTKTVFVSSGETYKFKYKGNQLSTTTETVDAQKSFAIRTEGESSTAGRRVVRGGKEVQFDDRASNGFDKNAALEIEDTSSGVTAKFNDDGTQMLVTGKGDVSLKFTWNDNPSTSGLAVGTLKVGNGEKVSWTTQQKGTSGTDRKTIAVDATTTASVEVGKEQSKPRIISKGQVAKWDDDPSNGFDENARLTILSVTPNESSVKNKLINDFEEGFYPKRIGEFAQHTYGTALNWANMKDSYEGEFDLVGGDGTGLRVKARFEALFDENNEPKNTRYTILKIINSGENYTVGNTLSFPDQGGYSFSGMGELVKLLTVDFGVAPDSGLCDIIEPTDTKDIPEDVPDDDPDDDCVIVRRMLLEDPNSLTYMKKKEGYWKDKTDKEYYCPDKDIIPTTGCLVDSDCPEGQICINGECVPDPGPECTVDADCPKGQVCIDGVCVPEDDVIEPPPDDDPDDDDDDDDDDDECKIDDDCPEGQVCVKGKCVVPCSLDKDCPEGYVCVDGICKLACKIDEDCPDGQICVDGVCVPDDDDPDDDDDDDDPDDPPPSTPVIVDDDGGVVSVPIPPELKDCSVRYKQPPLIAISGLGTGAIAKADLDEHGCLISIIVKSKGIGYTPNVDAAGECGILSEIALTNVGGYYESSPTVYVNGDPTIAFAAIEDGKLVEIRITNPQNIVYDRLPDIRIRGANGFGGSAKPIIQFVPCDEVAERYLRVVNKYNDSTIGTVFIVDCP